MLRKAILATFFTVFATSSWAQSALLQSGPYAPGHVPMYANPTQAQPIVQDSGPAKGGPLGVGLSEFGITSRSPTNTYPSANSGSGPFNTHSCMFDGPTNNASGYHYLCFDPNAQGGGLVAYGAYGAATKLPFNFMVNGTAYQFPFLTAGILGPSTTVVGHSVVWNNTIGTLVADSGGTPVNGPASSTANHLVLWNSTTGSLVKDGGLTLPTASIPAFTGDVTNAAGSAVTTVGTIGGQTVSLGGALTTTGPVTTAGAFTTTGANALTIATTGPTSIVAPTTGTLATTANISTALPSATTSQIYGGTGSAGVAQAITMGTNVALSGATLNVATTSVPTGRLTLTSGVPVLSSPVTAATTLYYTPYNGSQVPVWNGSAWTTFVFTEASAPLSDSTQSPAAAVANSVYDVFVWVSGGSLVVSRGPVWTNTTTRSAGTALSRVGGYLVNTNTITNGPAAGYGLYVGTIATDSTGGTLTFNPQPAAASGGPTGGAWVGVWNQYNRVNLIAAVQDSKASWSTTSYTWRQADNTANNRISFVSGQTEDPQVANYSCAVDNTSNSTISYIGVAVSNITIPQFSSFEQIFSSQGQIIGLNVPNAYSNSIGVAYFQAMEAGTATTFYSASGQTMNLSAVMRF